MSTFFINEIDLNPYDSKPVYLQLANSLETLIKRGVLKPGFRFPGTRKLAKLLNLHRNTVFAALDELAAEGWIVTEKRKGVYVNRELPLHQYQRLHKHVIGTWPDQTPYPITRDFEWMVPVRHRSRLEFNDGLPDVRLAPVREIRREYTSLLQTPSLKYLLSYTDPRGDEKLRASIAGILKEHRGLDVTADQIMITEGSIMGLYLLSQVLVTKEDTFVIESPGYNGASRCFKAAGCRMLYIPVDKKGINTDLLEDRLQSGSIKAVYVTSHHQHPTTVSLAPERRMRLLHLAQTHRFAIIEDDYDYEFHYENKPLLPIASADNTGSVIYIGSFSKTLYPSLRIGYLVGPGSLIDALAKLRFIIDNNGNTVLERALSRVIDNGMYYRHVRKSLNHYRERKKLFCSILERDFSKWISYEKPEGGMAVWAAFNKRVRLKDLISKCRQKGLNLSGNTCYDPLSARLLSDRQNREANRDHLNSIRLGFASMNEKEIVEACEILKDVLSDAR